MQPVLSGVIHLVWIPGDVCTQPKGRLAWVCCLKGRGKVGVGVGGYYPIRCFAGMHSVLMSPHLKFRWLFRSSECVSLQVTLTPKNWGSLNRIRAGNIVKGLHARLLNLFLHCHYPLFSLIHNSVYFLIVSFLIPNGVIPNIVYVPSINGTQRPFCQ